MSINWNKAEFFTSYGTQKQLPDSKRTEFVFSGRSNVGKSSLLNKIVNRKSLARVSQMPGKTVTINFYSVDSVDFVDLPGYGYAKAARDEKRRWSDLVEGYFAGERELGLIFQLIDFRHKPTEDDLAMINFLINNELPFVIILTKADKLKKKERHERLNKLITEIPYSEKIKKIEYSSVTGEGISEIKEIIENISESQ